VYFVKNKYHALMCTGTDHPGTKYWHRQDSIILGTG